MSESEIIEWLLKGDVSIQFQVQRDLMGNFRKDLRDRIELEGWGANFLSRRNDNGLWGKSYYQPKWISTHYTLLDLKNLGISPECKIIQESIVKIKEIKKSWDGGFYPFTTKQKSDVCVNGMLLNFLSYFKVEGSFLESIVDFLLHEHMQDGGFNCFSNSTGAIHSSMHSTISVLEGILEYERNGYLYRLNDLLEVRNTAHEFLLKHHLYKSHRTGEIISKTWLLSHYPYRWKYDILRALDYFQEVKFPYDDRMSNAIYELNKRRLKDGRWKLASHYPGLVHFHMENPGEVSRWNTLRALRVLKYYG